MIDMGYYTEIPDILHGVPYIFGAAKVQKKLGFTL
jgi:hypothetical protein